MNSSEIFAEMAMDYDKLVAYLLNKYGKAQYNYFLNDRCVSKNQKVTRTSEGLLCHHIDENIYDNLSEPRYAIRHPFANQKADRLVYCNYIEHLLLHIQIGKDRYWKTHSTIQSPALFSAFIMPGMHYICYDLNELYDKQGSTLKWKMRCYRMVEENLNDYVFILKSFIGYLEEHYRGPKLTFYVGKKVRHKILGEGIVTEINGKGTRAIVTIQFAEEKKLTYGESYDCFVVELKNELARSWSSDCVTKIRSTLG